MAPPVTTGDDHPASSCRLRRGAGIRISAFELGPGENGRFSRVIMPRALWAMSDFHTSRAGLTHWIHSFITTPRALITHLARAGSPFPFPGFPDRFSYVNDITPLFLELAERHLLAYFVLRQCRDVAWNAGAGWSAGVRCPQPRLGLHHRADLAEEHTLLSEPDGCPSQTSSDLPRVVRKAGNRGSPGYAYCLPDAES